MRRCTDEHARRLERVDPLATLSRRELRALARRADVLRRRDPARLEDLAATTALPLRRLRLLADAWAEGGASGVDALGPAVVTPPGHMAQAEEALARWRAARFPLELLRWEVWRNRVTVEWVVPAAAADAEPERRPLLQLRLSHGGRWHLYRRATGGEWWPVAVRGPRRRQSVEDCLEVVTVDGANRFWRARPAADPLPADPDRG